MSVPRQPSTATKPTESDGPFNPSRRGTGSSSGAEREPQTVQDEALKTRPAVCASGTWRLR